MTGSRAFAIANLPDNRRLSGPCLPGSATYRSESVDNVLQTEQTVSNAPPCHEIAPKWARSDHEVWAPVRYHSTGWWLVVKSVCNPLTHISGPGYAMSKSETQHGTT